MGRLPVKYLRFSLLVASVFIFAGSARASENKSTDVSIHTSGTAIVNDSSSDQEVQTKTTTITEESGPKGGSTKNISVGFSAKLEEVQNGVPKTASDKSLAIAAPDSNSATKPIAAASSTEAPVQASHLSDQKAAFAAPIVAKLSSYKVTSNLNRSGGSVNYVSSESSLASHHASEPATNNHGPSLPTSQSEMLIASLSQLLLSPNILVKMAGVGGLPTGVVPAVLALAYSLAYLGSAILVVVVAGSYILALRKSRFWHAARSITLPKLFMYKLVSGLAWSSESLRHQALFIGTRMSFNQVLNTGGIIQ